MNLFVCFLGPFVIRKEIVNVFKLTHKDEVKRVTPYLPFNDLPSPMYGGLIRSTWSVSLIDYSPSLLPSLKNFVIKDWKRKTDPVPETLPIKIQSETDSLSRVYIYQFGITPVKTLPQKPTLIEKLTT